MINCFPPEGRLLSSPENQVLCSSLHGLRKAMALHTILEGTALYSDERHNLVVSVGPFTGIIPRVETARGIAEGTTREIAIMTRVGKPVCFTVESVSEVDGKPELKLSRRMAQESAIQHCYQCCRSGSILPATVTHMEPFGAFVDIGCGNTSLIGIENISVSRISHPNQRFRIGQEIFTVIQELDPKEGRVYLTHKELLGTWEENASAFHPGMTVPGTVRGVKPYGLFVELTPNLSGLAEWKPGYEPGDHVSVYLKSIQPERMKIKLVMIDHLPPLSELAPMTYRRTSGVLEQWHYAPAGCLRIGPQSVFCA